MARCEICREKFKQVRFLQKTCSDNCEKEFRKEKPLKKISNKSSKRKIQESIYTDLRKVFLNKNTQCAVNPVHKATEIHHIDGRNGDRLNNVKDFLPVCRECHSFIHLNPIISRSKKWLK